VKLQKHYCSFGPDSAFCVRRAPVSDSRQARAICLAIQPSEPPSYVRMSLAMLPEYTEAMSVLQTLLIRSRPFIVVGLAAFCAGTTWAQWQWINADGRKVFSDTAPPASIPEKNILKRPGPRMSNAPAEEAAAGGPSGSSGQSAPTAPAAPVKDPQLEAKKKQAEEAEAAKRQAEQERIAKARAENCERAKRAKATLDSGVRIATTNAKGEREILDEKGRAAEAQRIDRIIASDCGPMPAPQ
jgi:type IV secretory pathway VirB10-like protein